MFKERQTSNFFMFYNHTSQLTLLSTSNNFINYAFTNCVLILSVNHTPYFFFLKKADGSVVVAFLGFLFLL